MFAPINNDVVKGDPARQEKIVPLGCYEEQMRGISEVEGIETFCVGEHAWFLDRLREFRQKQVVEGRRVGLAGASAAPETPAAASAVRETAAVPAEPAVVREPGSLSGNSSALFSDRPSLKSNKRGSDDLERGESDGGESSPKKKKDINPLASH